MDRYSQYVIEDFVMDSYFQRWVRFSHPEDQLYWEEFMQKNPLQKEDVLRARALLTSVYRLYATDISDEEISMEIHQLVERIRRERKKSFVDEKSGSPRRSLRSPFWWAAAAVLVIGAGVWYQLSTTRETHTATYQTFTQNKTVETYENDGTENRTWELKDGSTVTLEPGSTLDIPTDFPETSRDVFLTGTAQFNVKKDAERPFTVYSDKLVTRVLGTRFTVRAPRNGESVVEVAEGRVSVFRTTDFAQPAKEKMGMIVTSNQKIVLEPKEDRLIKELLDLPQIVAPLPPTVTFNYVDAPVSRVLKELMDAYHVEIIYDEEQLKGCTLNATLSDQTLYEKLAAICEAIEARYELIDGQITIHGKKCQ